MKKSLILLLILFLLSLLSTCLAKAYAADYSGLPIPQSIRTNANLPPMQISPYKDNNEKLYAIVGKTQLIKFDEPVKRISLTDPSLADLVLLSPKELLLNGKKAGRTSLLFWGNSEKPVFFNMVVQQDTDAVIQAIEQVAPNENVKYTFTDDGLILSGKISSTTVKNNIEDVVKAYGIKMLDLTESPTKQVLLEVKIAEASRSYVNSLQSKFSVGDNGTVFPSMGNGSFGSPGLDSSGKALAPITQYLFSSTSQNISWTLTAAETKGLVKILAEPKLLAIDGKAGSFNVGNQIPYPSSVGLSGTTAYAFKDTGVILNFTPTILEKTNRVVLKLSPEISEVDASVTSIAGIPGIKTRKVDTTVELADGETLIIAGLLSHNSQNSTTQVPGLGNIPGLGLLFSNFYRDRRDTEVVIFITPKIIDADTNTNDGRMEL